MSGRRRERTTPPVGLRERRRRLADSSAKQFIGVLYGVMFHGGRLDRKALKDSVDWQGLIYSLSIEFQRYADGEATRLLRGDLPASTPFLAARRALARPPLTPPTGP